LRIFRHRINTIRIFIISGKTQNKIGRNFPRICEKIEFFWPITIKKGLFARCNRIVWLSYERWSRKLIQYNTIQYNTIKYNTIQYDTIQYDTTQYNIIQYNTIQYETIQYNTIKCNTIQYNLFTKGVLFGQYNTIIQYNTIQYITYNTISYNTIE